jgi:hypothetical protein
MLVYRFNGSVAGAQMEPSRSGPASSRLGCSTPRGRRLLALIRTMRPHPPRTQPERCSNSRGAARRHARRSTERRGRPLSRGSLRKARLIGETADLIEGEEAAPRVAPRCRARFRFGAHLSLVRLDEGGREHEAAHDRRSPASRATSCSIACLVPIYVAIPSGDMANHHPEST